MTENSRAVHEEDESRSNVHKCTVCFSEFNSLRGMRAHCIKTHRSKPCSSTTTDQHPSDLQGNETAQDSVRCSACANVFASLREVRLHQSQCHCLNHRLERAIKDAFKGTVFDETCTLLSNIHTVFERSSKRWQHTLYSSVHHDTVVASTPEICHMYI